MLFRKGLLDTARHCLASVYHQEVQTNTGLAGFKESGCCWVNAQDFAFAVQQYKAFAHGRGSLLKLVGFLFQLCHLGRDLLILLFDAVQKRRDLIVCIAGQRIVQIQVIEGIDDPIGHSPCQH